MALLTRRLRLLPVIALLVLVIFGTDALADRTVEKTIHEAGRCAIRGQCGKTSFFGKELPCPDNGLAKEPENETRRKLVSICGQRWSTGKICCNEEQVMKPMFCDYISANNLQLDALGSNLKTAESIISSCPACKENFFNLFCTFTCSPDQSLFVNVTATGESTSKKIVVTDLDNLWSDEYGLSFYNSCKDIKFGATGGKAMDFIGGGATNFTEFLKFLGDKKLLVGSPFQINFPRPSDRDDNLKAADPPAKSCNDSDPAFRCTCVDCPAACPELEKITEQEYCYVGILPCLSFAAVLLYSIFLLLVVFAIIGHMARRKQLGTERVPLLQETEESDDEDDRDIRVHSAGLLEKPHKDYYLNALCDRMFRSLGGMCARFPLMIISISFGVVVLLSLGWMNFEVETNPVRLWVSPSSRAAEEKAFFDANFGRFYRAQQVFLVNDTQPSGPGPVLNYGTLDWWMWVERLITDLRSSPNNISFEDVCFNPTGKACVVQSVSGYFGGPFEPKKLSNWKQHVRYCTDHPGDTACLPPFQQPLSKDIILGSRRNNEDVLESEAMIVTWVVNNHPPGSEAEARAMEWEETLKNFLLDLPQSMRKMGLDLRLSFSTEISLEQELNKSTNTDAKIIVISYIIMFLYASIALGSVSQSLTSLIKNPSNLLVQSKFFLGVSGIVIVLMSVSASVGLFSAAGIKVTLIIAEVIPFLVLAVGVDNIFLIVHEFERVNQNNPDEEIETRIAKTLGRMGPSILLSASTETIAFALGCFVGMPAVKNFAVYAAGAVFINAILQVTMFMSVLALNQKRVESNRVDCFPCIKLKRSRNMHNFGEVGYEDQRESTLQRYIRKYYAPMLLKREVKVFVVAVFLGLLTSGAALIPKVALGLDQRIAIPSDSYLTAYFNDLSDYFATGPPVYFVTRDLNTTQRKHQQEICSRFTTCDQYSLATVLEQESKRSSISYITGSTASWLDDFLYWLNPGTSDSPLDCCMEHGRACFENRLSPWNVTLFDMPEGAEFIHYLEKWLNAPTNEECPLGGKAPYSTAVVVDLNQTTTSATHFRTAHTPLRSQKDFIAAYASARRIANDISKAQDISVFPYSVFYIFFDQYITIISLTITLISSALAIILVISSILLGSLATGAIVTFTVTMIVVDVVGVMALANVSLNAVSLVNLIICVGIGVEFCAHIARAFMFPSQSVVEKAKAKYRGKDARAWAALVNVGGSVFSGITITKLLGVSVLAFTRSQIFEVYYFRIWLALVGLAALHALVFLPVALSLFGGDGEWTRQIDFYN